MADRPFGRAVGKAARTGRVLDRGAGAPDVLPELLDRHVIGAPVVVAVDADLVPALDRLADELRTPPRDPPQKENGRAVASLFQQVEKPMKRRLDPRRKRVPAAPVGVVVLAADVEPVFRVDGQDPRRGTGRAEKSDDGR